MPTLRTPSMLVAVAALGTLALVSSCGKSGDKGASSPTGASTPPPVAGTPPPTAAEPSPAPTPSLQGATCERLTLGTGSDSTCREQSVHIHEGALEAAQASVHAEYMDGNTIMNFSGYKADIVAALDQDGICAVFESDNLFMRAPGDEFNEYYDVITSTGGVARRYTNTCQPPVPTPVLPGPPPVRDPTCTLPPSQETICTGDSEPYFSEEVRAAIDAVIADDRARAVPIVFNFNEQHGEGGFGIIDATLYHEEVIKKLRAQGFCAWYDDEEIQVKNSNLFSSHWDIYKAEAYRIQLFAGVCRDAAF